MSKKQDFNLARTLQLLSRSWKNITKRRHVLALKPRKVWLLKTQILTDIFVPCQCKSSVAKIRRWTCMTCMHKLKQLYVIVSIYFYILHHVQMGLERRERERESWLWQPMIFFHENSNLINVIPSWTRCDSQELLGAGEEVRVDGQQQTIMLADAESLSSDCWEQKVRGVSAKEKLVGG